MRSYKATHRRTPHDHRLRRLLRVPDPGSLGTSPCSSACCARCRRAAAHRAGARTADRARRGGFIPLGGKYALDYATAPESVAIAGGLCLFDRAAVIFPPPEGLMAKSPWRTLHRADGDPAGRRTFRHGRVRLMGSNDPARLGDWSLALLIAWAATAAIPFAATYLYNSSAPARSPRRAADGRRSFAISVRCSWTVSQLLADIPVV